jgi:ribosomal protein L24|nr:MAG TPA: tail tube protein [Caudoviricetes sp.]
MHLPNGSQVFVESKRDNAIEVTNITKADIPELTFKTAPNLAVGDYVIITSSNWAKLINKVGRVKSVTTSSNKVTIEGFSTKDGNIYSGTGTGKICKVSEWIEIPCVQDLSQEGGEQQFYTYQCLADDREQQIPTYKSAVSLTYTFAHEYDNAIYPILRTADESGEVKVMRMYVPRAKEMRIWSGTLSFNEIPQTAVNEMETVSLTVSLKGDFASMASTAS